MSKKPTAQIVTKRLVNMDKVIAIIEDNLPHCDLEKESISILRVRKSTNIGAEVSLYVHSLSFSRGNIQKLRESGISDTLLDGLEQAADEAPIGGSELQAYLKQTLNKKKANELFRKHMTTISKVCTLNTLITISEWDPNQFLGALTFGSSYHIANRTSFVKELAQLLSANIEHSSKEVPNNCFIATAASGDANDPNVIVLRRFRDQRLVQSYFGRLFIQAYEVWGPVIARKIRHSLIVRQIVYTICVRPCAKFVSGMVDARDEKDEREGYYDS